MTLKLHIDDGSSTPIFQQVAEGIERMILTGVIAAGDFIPSVREIAVSLAVNPNTVAKAYAQLQTAGLVEPVRGMGLRVIPMKSAALTNRRGEILAAKVRELLAEAEALGFSKRDIQRALDQCDASSRRSS